MSTPQQQQGRDVERDRLERQAEFLGDAAAEVVALLPALPAALPRDSAGPSAVSADRVTTSRDPSRSAVPVNLAVAEALLVLPVAIAQADRDIRRLLGDEPWSRPVVEQVRAMPGYYGRLIARGGHGKSDDERGYRQAASWLAGEVFRWQRQCRKATGLKRPAHPLPSRTPCPYGCVDDSGQRAALLVDGDEATVAGRIIAGAGQGGRPEERRHNAIAGSYGQVGRSYAVPVDLYEAWSWRSTDTIFCPVCGRRWEGAVQLRTLGAVIHQSRQVAAGTVVPAEPAPCVHHWQRVSTYPRLPDGTADTAHPDITWLCTSCGKPREEQ